MKKARDKQKTHLVLNKDKMEPLPPGPVFLNMLPERGQRCKQHRQKLKKKRKWGFLLAERCQGRSPTRQPPRLTHIWNLFFNDSSLWVVWQWWNTNSAHRFHCYTQTSVVYPCPSLPERVEMKADPTETSPRLPRPGCSPAIGCLGLRTLTSWSLRLITATQRISITLVFPSNFWKIKQSTSAFWIVYAVLLKYKSNSSNTIVFQ